MVKICCYGKCRSDTRYPVVGIQFHPFPKPKTRHAACLRWIKACGRPHSQLSQEKISRHSYVCSKHFSDGQGPTKDYPDPIPADGSKVVQRRTHWKDRVNITMPSQKENWSETASAPCEEPNTTDLSSTTEAHTETGLMTSATGHITAVQPAATHTDVADTECKSLEMLSTAAHIRQLEARVQQQDQQIHQLKLLNMHYQEHITQRGSVPAASQSFGVNMVLDRETGKSNIKDLFLYYTGLIYHKFVALFLFLSKNGNIQYDCNRKDYEKLSQEDQLFLTLMRLRQNYGLKDLATRFCISPQSAGVIFNQWVRKMYCSLGQLPLWPHRNNIIKNMPSKFRAQYPNTMAIIDGTELKTQRPHSLKLQSQCYSDYKSHNTLKALIACDPNGSVTFVSGLFTGSISDNDITEQSGFYTLLKNLLEHGYLKPGDAIMADKGFKISEKLRELGLDLNIPPFARSNKQMPETDLDDTLKIAAHRVHVERCIARIKTFKIISGTIPTTLFGNINEIWTVCTLLTLCLDTLVKK